MSLVNAYENPRTRIEEDLRLLKSIFISWTKPNVKVYSFILFIRCFVHMKMYNEKVLLFLTIYSKHIISIKKIIRNIIDL